ncbi:hypothetical protein AYJ57_23185 (plasmid) [Salipiger sp. CCB-MM3]|nr:hypothetical protein AYJ57_23185 [Salipiger sp. CCB-MM3]
MLAAIASLHLPHFVVVRAMKCGTSTRYGLLANHQDIDMSRDKEPDFFLRKKNFGKRLEWYSDQLSGEVSLCGQASRNYTQCHIFRSVPERMAQFTPDVRLIDIVRDPVLRAESHIRHNVITGNLEVGIDEFVEQHVNRNALDTSRFALQREAYLEHFPAEAILVVDLDELTQVPQRVMPRIHDHIGVADREISVAGVQNDSGQLARVPAPILRLAKTPQGRAVAMRIGRGFRDRLRIALARGNSRKPPPLPEASRAAARRSDPGCRKVLRTYRPDVSNLAAKKGVGPPQRTLNVQAAFPVFRPQISRSDVFRNLEVTS